MGHAKPKVKLPGLKDVKWRMSRPIPEGFVTKQARIVRKALGIPFYSAKRLGGEDVNIFVPLFMSKPLQISSTEILDRLILSCQIPLVVREVVRHQIIDRAIQTEGILVSDLELQQAADQFRIQHDLYDPQTTWHWLKKNHLTGDDFEKLIYEAIATAKLARPSGDRSKYSSYFS